MYVYIYIYIYIYTTPVIALDLFPTQAAPAIIFASALVVQSLV